MKLFVLFVDNRKEWNSGWLFLLGSLGCFFLYSESISENYFVGIFVENGSET